MAKFSILHIFLVLTDFEIHQVNVVTAYLQDNLDENIYMNVLDRVQELESDGHY